MRRSLQAGLFVLFLALSGFTASMLVVQAQTDTFDSDLENWTTGALHPDPPTHVADGGPTGAGDGFMSATTTGQNGPGQALVVFNDVQWSGDYAAGGVTSISMDLKNLGPNDIYARLVLEKNSPKLISSDSVRVPVGSGWITGTFSLAEADLTDFTGSAVYADVISDVTRLRIIHAPTPDWPAPIVTATVGIDNISSAGTPLPVELLSFDATTRDGTIDLRWSTAIETSNLGFDVMEQGKGDQQFRKIGFVGSQGDNSSYRFSVERAVGEYRYRLRQIDLNGTATLLPVVEVSIVPSSFAIEAPYPNPASSYTTVDILSPDSRRARISVIDILGREISLIHDGPLDGVRTSLRIDTEGYSSGPYYLHVSGPGGRLFKSFTVIR